MLLCKDQKRFAYQCVDNVQMYEYVKCDQNIPCGSRVMSYTVEMMLGEASSPQIAGQW